MRVVEAYIAKTGETYATPIYPALQLVFIEDESANSYSISAGYHLAYPAFDDDEALVLIILPEVCWLENKVHRLESIWRSYVFALREA